MRTDEFPKLEIVSKADIAKFDVIRVGLKDIPEKVMAVVLARMFNLREQLISFEVFPVEPVLPDEEIGKASSFGIYSEGYKEQMGLPFSENFKINFTPVTLLVGTVDEIEKIGYVAMGNAKEIMLDEFENRASYENPDSPTIPAFTVMAERKKTAKASKPKDPTISQLIKKGELSEYTGNIFNGHILDKKEKPLINEAGEKITVRTLTDLHNVVSSMGAEGMAKKIYGLGKVFASEVVEEVNDLMKLYPQ